MPNSLRKKFSTWRRQIQPLRSCGVFGASSSLRGICTSFMRGLRPRIRSSSIRRRSSSVGDAHHVTLGRAEDPPRLAPFLVAEQAAAQVGGLADIERLQEEAEVALHEDIDAARIVRDAVLGQRALEHVAFAALSPPEMNTVEQNHSWVQP